MENNYMTDPDSICEEIRWIDCDMVAAATRLIAEAVTAADVCSQEVVADACILTWRRGGDWRAELSRAVSRDEVERKALGIDE